MLGIGRRTAAEEIEAETAPALGSVEVAVDILAVELLALEELGDFLNLLPGLRHAPFALVTFVLPGLAEVAEANTSVR
jgi:hypothetical protein